MDQKRFKFTKKTLESITPPESGSIDYFDTENKYLRLRVTSRGTRTFYLVRKVHGNTKFVKLGRFPETTVSQARKRCEEEGTKLLTATPTRRSADTRMTFGELFEKYLEGHAKPLKKTWREDVRQYDTLVKAEWEKKRVRSITTEMVDTLHKRIGTDRGKYAANRIHELLRVVFNYAIRTLRIDMENPCIGVERYPEKGRKRFLKAEELQRFFEALNDVNTSALWRDFFSLLLWTGARKANVQAMQWKHIDLAAAVWTIPGEEFKNGEDMEVVLTEPALEILKRRKLTNEAPSPYVFPAPSKDGHVVEPRKAWLQILKRAGLADVEKHEHVDGNGNRRTKEHINPRVRIHDLRRTLGSWQAATGASIQMIGRTLGHRSASSTLVYSRLDLDPVRASVNTATAAMMAAIEGHAKGQCDEETDD